MATTDLGKWMITNGGDYDPDVTYEKLTMVMYDNSTYITLKTVTGVTPSNDQINYALMARGFDPGVLSSVTAVDTSGALGNAGETVSAQSLVDYLADAVMTKLVEKANISNVQVNDSSKVPSAALAYAMQQQITENEEAITGLNSDLKGFNFSKSLDIDIMTTFSCNLPPSFALVWGGIRAGGTADNEGLFFILVDSTQGKFSYTPILTGEIESVEWLNSQLTITFARASYWQINAIYVDSVG